MTDQTQGAPAPTSPTPPSKGREIKITVALLLGLGALGWYVRSRSDAPEPLTLEEQYQQDPRLQPLMFDCPFGRTFDADTSDLVPMMVGKLERGERGPMRSYKEELAALGSEVVPPLRRLFDECYGDANRTGVLTNILAVCALMPEDTGLEMAALAMEHPRSNVRLGALDSFARHGTWEHYGLVRGWLDSAASSQEASDFMRTLLLLDSPRFFREFQDFLKQGRFQESALLIATRIHRVVDPEIVEGFYQLGISGDVQNQVVPFLVAPAARDGHPEALEFLRERLKSDRQTRVQFTLEALRRCELGMEAGQVLIHDERTGLRKLAAEILGELKSNEKRTSWLHQGLSDPDASVRGVCMTALIREQDPLAQSQALALLSGTAVERDRGIQAMTGTVETTPFQGAQGTIRVSGDATTNVLDRRFQAIFAGTPELALRGLDILKAEYAQSPDHKTRLSILKAVGRLPVAAAAEFLLDCAPEIGQVGNLSGLRWCAGQAFNTGPEGHAVLRARLAAETDPIARLDLIEFVWQDHSDASREMLLGLLANINERPYEGIYLADRLTRMRASARVAPAIKQAYLGNTHIAARPALQCLLWKWYGQHFE